MFLGFYTCLKAEGQIPMHFFLKVVLQTYIDFEALYCAIQKVDITDDLWSSFLFW